MKIHNCVHFVFCCALCAASLAWAVTDVDTRSRRATPSPDSQVSDRPASSALPVVRPTVTTQSPSQASGPEKLDRDQQLLATPSSASGELEDATRKPRRKGRKRLKTTTPGLDIAPDRGRDPSRPNNDGDVRATTLTSTRLPVINDEGGTDDGGREGKAVTSNVTDASSGDDIHTENSNGEKTPIYWPWGPQRNGKNNASLSAQNLTAAQSAGLLNESFSGDRGNVYWPWGPNDKLRNVSSSEGNTSRRPDSEGGDASSDLQNPGQGRPQHVPWPWGPGVRNSSRSSNPGGNGSSGLASSHHVHHNVPELDDARLADASVVVAKAEGMYFIQRLFQRYTSKQDSRGRLSASDLAALLENILFKGAAEKTEAAHHVHLESSAEPPLYRPQGDLSGGYQGLHEEHSHCLSAQQLLQAFHYETGEGLDYRRFMYLCPALLYQLDSSLCAPHSHGPAGSHEHLDHATNSSHSHALNSDDSAGWKRWLVAVGSVLVISVVGLACVLAVQRVRSSIRHFLLPFLVALAVGALSGDALLHLLPHALAADHADGGGDHRAGVWKGLTALTGMLVFWSLENVLRLCQRRRSRKKHAKDLLGIRAADIEKSKSHMTEMELREEEVMLQIKHSLSDKTITETDVVVRDGHFRPETEDDHHHHHHHGHSHEHAHSVPEGMAAILSMVVLGDGIHNLLDGMAIGAAFTAGLTSGLSTALAVLCHELPHEIGDFAMLLSAGMSVRRALLFNCVSSALCMLGCLVGLAVGDTASLTMWLLSAVAGLFLFLALVTMLPQLREEREAESFRGFLLRASGILLGAGIMLVIAVFEDELKTLLEV